MPTFQSNGKDSNDQVERSRNTVVIVQSSQPLAGRLLISFPKEHNNLNDLAHVARKYHVVLISDEIYGLLHHTAQHISIARFYPEGTIISSGLSKWCGAGGWRLGTFSFPSNLRWLQDAMAIVASETYTATSAPIQYAAITAFKGGDYMEEYLHKSRKILRELSRILLAKLRSFHVVVPQPHGAFYFFPDFEYYREKLKKRGIFTSVELCKRILNDTGVAMLPGNDFGRQPEELTARIAYVAFNGKEVLEATNDINNHHLNYSFYEKHCAELIEAIDQLGNWFDTL